MRKTGRSFFASCEISGTAPVPRAVLRRRLTGVEIPLATGFDQCQLELWGQQSRAKTAEVAFVAIGGMAIYNRRTVAGRIA